MKNKVLILGTGWLARDIADLLEDIPNYELGGFVVDQPPFERGIEIFGKPIYWIDELEDLDNSYRAVCALGSMKKINIIRKVNEMGIPFINLIHPTVQISRTVTMGEGVIISSGVHIAAFTSIGNHVFINRASIISHEVSIGDYSFVSAGANISCHVNIKQSSFIGIGAIILGHLSVGEKSIVGSGSLVTRDVPDRVKVVGNPAIIIEKDIDGFF